MSTRALTGFRINAFAALTMLLLEFCLGTGLYGAVPDTDHGLGTFAAFVAAVVAGPILLSLHAILGTLLIVSAITMVVRTILARLPGHIALSGVGLAATVIAWIAGAQAVGGQTPAAGTTMQLAAAAAMFCYALTLFLLPHDHSRSTDTTRTTVTPSRADATRST